MVYIVEYKGGNTSKVTNKWAKALLLWMQGKRNNDRATENRYG